MFVKKQYDSGADKSRKQEIDKDVLPLVDALNALDDFYTTSSCSGRTVLLEKASQRKCDAKWIYSTHDKPDYAQIRKVLFACSENPIWFKQESMILHICCRTYEHAVKLLNLARQAGFKRSGIISANKRIIVEITGTERIDTIIAQDGKVLIDDEYLQVLVREADKKMQANWERINKLAQLVNGEKL